MAGCGGCVAVAKGNESLVELLVCGQEMWEHRFMQLEILSLFNSGSAALLMETYLSVLHSEQLLSLPYWTFPGLNKAVLLSLGSLFSLQIFIFSSPEINLLPFFQCRWVCGAWNKPSWQIQFLLSWTCSSEQSTGHTRWAAMQYVTSACPSVILLPFRNTEMGSHENSCICPFLSTCACNLNTADEWVVKRNVCSFQSK